MKKISDYYIYQLEFKNIFCFSGKGINGLQKTSSSHFHTDIELNAETRYFVLLSKKCHGMFCTFKFFKLKKNKIEILRFHGPRRIFYTIFDFWFLLFSTLIFLTGTFLNFFLQSYKMGAKEQIVKIWATKD